MFVPVTPDKIIAFSNDLDRHCLTHTGFFNIDLLLLFEKHFLYHDLSMTVYTDEYKFCGGVAINNAQSLQDYYIKNKVYEYDLYARMITEKSKSTSGIKSLILDSRKALPESDYKSDKYREFLRIFGYSWTATMVFGNYRFSIHKKEDDVFTEDEIDFLNQIHTLLISRVALFEHVAARRSISDYQREIMDQCNTGYVILNQNWNSLCYNDTAYKYLANVTGLNNMVSSVKTILAILGVNSSSFAQKDKITRTHGDKLFVISKHMEKQEFDFYVTKYTMIILNRHGETVENSVSKELFRKKYSISQKEQNVIDMLAKGLTYAQTAEKLYISINTVRSHIKSIYAKAGVNNLRSLLALYKDIEG